MTTKANPQIWVNMYDEYGLITNSTPFDTYKEAHNAILNYIEMANSTLLPSVQYKWSNFYEWKNGSGKTIKVETKGNAIVYIINLWGAISANYTRNINTSDQLIQYIFRNFGYNEEKIKAYAEEYYTKGRP